MAESTGNQKAPRLEMGFPVEFRSPPPLPKPPPQVLFKLNPGDFGGFTPDEFGR